MGSRVAPALVLVILGSTAPVRAQVSQVSLGGGWYVPGGDSFDGTDSGAGYDVAVRFAVAPDFTLGVGAQWNIHGVNFTPDNYDVVGVFAEPRWDFPSPGSLRPFVSGRVAWVRQSIAISGRGRAASGFGIGVVAGVVFALTDGVGLDVGLAGYLLSFGDFSEGGARLRDTGSSGNAVGIRVALDVRP